MAKRILMAMSGGVDSSLAAALLVEQGFDVIGATMKTFCYSGPEITNTKTCCGLDGIADARSVAHTLGIPHYVFDVEEEFTRDVIDDFVSEYSQGRTPNPCVRCNSNTKFRDLFERGKELECDGVATGHYVRMDHSDPEHPRLLRGIDSAKDQSYFLWGLPKSMLGFLRFPLGELTKPEVRARARAMELTTADKPESQEICFVPTGNYRDLLEKRLLPTHPALTPGPIVHLDGRVLGEHPGYAGFTIGQRKGLGGGSPEPLFVIKVVPGTREVIVGPRSALFMAGVHIHELNWLAEAPSVGDRVSVQIRYGSTAVRAEVTALEPGNIELTFGQPIEAITPGQSGVIFQDSQVLGGGRIKSGST